MKRPACVMCKGKGKRKRLSFVDHRKRVTETCPICRGTGAGHWTVDLFDVLEYLRGVGSGAFGAAATAIEKKFGPKSSKEKGSLE